MKRTIVRTARLGLGVVLIVAGIVSGFLPILQGWVFILAGLTVMAPESHYARQVLHWAKEKFAIHKKNAAAGDAGASRCGGTARSSDSVPPTTLGSGPLQG